MEATEASRTAHMNSPAGHAQGFPLGRRDITRDTRTTLQAHKDYDILQFHSNGQQPTERQLPFQGANSGQVKPPAMLFSQNSVVKRAPLLLASTVQLSSGAISGHAFSTNGPL